MIGRVMLGATVALGIAVGLCYPASARVWIGFGFPLYAGPPAYYYPPPVYYPPPAYYPPPPAYYYGAPAAPPRYTPSNQSCATVATVCPMEHPVPQGSSCYCTTGQGRVWGRAT